MSSKAEAIKILRLLGLRTPDGLMTHSQGLQMPLPHQTKSGANFCVISRMPASQRYIMVFFRRRVTGQLQNTIIADYVVEDCDLRTAYEAATK